MFRTIESSLWTDPKVKALQPGAKLLFVYLITNSHSHMSGLYYLPQVVIEDELGLSKKVAADSLNTLSGLGLIRIDHERQLIWVRRMFFYQARGKKNEIAAARHMETLHKSSLIREFLEVYPDVGKHLRRTLNTLSEVGVKEQEKEQDQEKVSLRPPPDSSNPPENSESRRSWTDRPPKPPEDLDWRIALVWEAHLKARVKFFERVNGAAPQNPPTLTPDLRKGIRAAILEHDGELLGTEKRDAFRRDSRARAAGIGIFYDPFLTGSSTDNDIRNGGKRYLEPERCWVPQRGKPNPVSRFAELYFEQRAAWELAQGVPAMATQEART